jgi:hypothetical protein
LVMIITVISTVIVIYRLGRYIFGLYKPAMAALNDIRAK